MAVLLIASTIACQTHLDTMENSCTARKTFLKKAAFSMTAIGISIIIFFASFVRGTLGFGDALIAMPLLAMLIGTRLASPLVACNSMILCLLILSRTWRDLCFRSLWPLVLASFCGIPIGVYGMRSLPEWIVQIILGVCVIVFSVLGLTRPSPESPITGKAAFPFGVVAGILGGAYNTNGPPIVLFGLLRKWTPDQFRAILQGYFFLCGIMIVVSHNLAGLHTHELLRTGSHSLPGLLVGTIMGHAVAKRIHPENFHRAAYIMLLCIGLFTTIKTILA